MAITINGSGITSSEIADGTITNADINASAGIVGSKLSSLSVPYAANASDDAWFYTHSATSTSYTTAINLPFTVQKHKGANITASSGAFTVGNAGLYLISATITNNSTSNATSSWYLYVDGAYAYTSPISGRLYHGSAAEIHYLSDSATIMVMLSAGQVVSFYGTGDVRHGDMTYISGVKIGENA
jgi:hypothetical protein